MSTDASVDTPKPWSSEQLADSIVLPAFDLAADGRSWRCYRTASRSSEQTIT